MFTRIAKRFVATAIKYPDTPEYFFDYAKYSFKLIETTPPVCSFCNKPITKFQCMSSFDTIKLICPMFKPK